MPLWHFDRQLSGGQSSIAPNGVRVSGGPHSIVEVVAPRVAPCTRQETESSFRADTVSLATFHVATDGAIAASWGEVGDRA
jgi:hypothetical protein